MKRTIELTDIFNTTDNSLSVRLVCDTLTDDSQVHNVEVVLFDIRQAYTTCLENSDCTCLAEASDKYKTVVEALQGFQMA